MRWCRATAWLVSGVLPLVVARAAASAVQLAIAAFGPTQRPYNPYVIPAPGGGCTYSRRRRSRVSFRMVLRPNLRVLFRARHPRHQPQDVARESPKHESCIAHESTKAPKPLRHGSQLREEQLWTDFNHDRHSPLSPRVFPRGLRPSKAARQALDWRPSSRPDKGQG
jgi:hypothetical protein